MAARNSAERQAVPPPRKPRAERAPQSENREKLEKGPHDVITVSFASTKHAERNGDSTVGSVERAMHDLQNLPDVSKTAQPESDAETLKSKLETEIKYAADARKLGYAGAIDGVSGDKNGSDALASRFISAKAAEIFATKGDVQGREATWEVLEEAANASHADIMEHKQGRSDLKEMAAAATMGRVIKDEDGGYEYPFIHMGDTVLYSVDGETGKLTQHSQPDDALEKFVEMKLISDREAQMIRDSKTTDELIETMRAENPDMVPAVEKKMRMISAMSEAVVSGIGSPEFKPRRGVITGLKKGDRLFSASDALTKNFSNEQVEEMIRKGADAQDLAIAAAKAKYADDATVQEIVIGKNEGAAESGELDIDVDVEEDTRLTPEERARHADLGTSIDERRRYMKGLKNLQSNRGATVEREKVIMEQRRVLIEELKLDYQMRSRALAELQREAGVDETEATSKLDMNRRNADWQQSVYDAAEAVQKRDFAALEKIRGTENGEFAANFVEGELKSKIETPASIMKNASEEVARIRASVEKLGKLAFEHQKMADISEELHALERERDAARAAEDAAGIENAHKLLDEAAADAAKSNEQSKRATPPPRKKPLWKKTGNE